MPSLPTNPRRRALTALAGWAAVAGGASAQTASQSRKGVLQVAVAASNAAFMTALRNQLANNSALRFEMAIGSTGALYAQIRHGAPYDVLVAADEDTPRRLVSDGLAAAGSQTRLGLGRLVLWSARADWVDSRGDVLRQLHTERLALANPKVAPYGAAAQQVLQKLELATRLQRLLVYAESTAQAYQFVASGNAALGFLARSQLRGPSAPRHGSSWLVPAQLHTPLSHSALVLRPGHTHPQAGAFIQALQSPMARRLLQDFGYDPE